MVEKKKRRTLPPRGDPKAKKPVLVKAGVPDRLGAPIEEREHFGENTFAGALEAVKGVLEKAAKDEAAKGRKKS
ncbi:MAG: hypothetical protein JNK82_14255 [Myxococcaceae bacterium]|nr:hypothetical protein [Myxococcaceae bacterium]